MLHARFLCKSLRLLCMAAGIFYGATLLYAVVCLLTWQNITAYDGRKFLHINYPFTSKPFLNIENNAPYIIFSFLLPLALYTLFFVLAANVFKVFCRPRLFTKDNLIHLKRFYLLNLAIPLPSAFLSSFFTEVESAIWLLVVVHFILGVFTLLIALIFQQGLKLQHEQDLFI